MANTMKVIDKTSTGLIMNENVMKFNWSVFDNEKNLGCSGC